MGKFILIACLGLGGCSHVYVAGEVNQQVAGGVHYVVAGRDYERTPRAQLELGMKKEVGRWEWRGGVRHESIPELPSDRGQERVFVRVEVQPWN